MNLDNRTPLPAQVTVSELPGETDRIGILTAKATFKFDRTGQVELDTQNPFPLLSKDQETPLGPLPIDSRARRSDKFEVMLLGNAYPPEEVPRPSRSRSALEPKDASFLSLVTGFG